MWKGRAQLGPLKIGVVDKNLFSSVNASRYASVQKNCPSFISKVNKGDANLDMLSINRL